MRILSGQDVVVHIFIAPVNINRFSRCNGEEMVLANWFIITLVVIAVSALVLPYYLIKRSHESLWDVPRRLWFKMDEALRAVNDGVYKKPWSKVYGQDVIQFFRELDAHAPGWEREEMPMFGRRLESLVTSLSDEERNELRETADAVIDRCIPVDYFELTRLTAYIGFLRSLSQFEKANKEKDAERFRKLCSIYDEMQKTKNRTEN